MKEFIQNSILIILLSGLNACSNDSNEAITETQEIAIKLHELFDEILPENIVSTLIYMGTDLNYDLTTLENSGNIIVDCQGNVTCFIENLSDQFIQDYTTAHLPATSPELILNYSDDTVWATNYDEATALIIFQHKTRNIQVEVDLYTNIFEGLPLGITPIIDGERFEAIGSNLQRRFLQPTEDGGRMTKIIIDIEGEKINTRFEGGTYGELYAQGGFCDTCDINDPEDVFFQSSIAINEKDKVQIELGGLYYFWFEKSNATTIDLISENSSGQFIITPEAYFTTYIPNVTHLLIDDGDNIFDVTTISNRLQIQAKEFAYPDLWQLDFDHNYKDTGQKSVTTTLIIN